MNENIKNLKENQIQIDKIADIFFQNNIYTGDSQYGSYQQSSIYHINEVIKSSSKQQLIAGYEMAFSRIYEILSNMFRAFSHVLYNNTNALKINEFLNDNISTIYTYLNRIDIIRSQILSLMGISEEDFNKSFGKYQDIAFLKHLIYEQIKEEDKNNKQLIKLIDYILKEYKTYKNQFHIKNSKQF